MLKTDALQFTSHKQYQSSPFSPVNQVADDQAGQIARDRVDPTHASAEHERRSSLLKPAAQVDCTHANEEPATPAETTGQLQPSYRIQQGCITNPATSLFPWPLPLVPGLGCLQSRLSGPSATKMSGKESGTARVTERGMSSGISRSIGNYGEEKNTHRERQRKHRLYFIITLQRSLHFRSGTNKKRVKIVRKLQDRTSSSTSYKSINIYCDCSRCFVATTTMLM